MSLLFTAFAIGGISNAVNLIDGYNGMASGFVILALLTLATVAGNAGDVPLQQSALLCAAAFAGFFLINWPWGRLFLGDSGAYAGGFVVAWLCVLLCERNERVSPLAVFHILWAKVDGVNRKNYRQPVQEKSAQGRELVGR